MFTYALGAATAVLLCLPTAFASEAASGRAVKPFFSKPLVLGAHRGGRSLWPENTLEAFKNAAARWPDALLEGDAQVTADGHVVLLHDKAVDRTTNGLAPACVRTCPTGAMSFGDRDAIMAQAEKRLGEVKAAGYAKAQLCDADSVRVVFLVLDDPKTYHEYAVASAESLRKVRYALNQAKRKAARNAA